MVITDSQIHLFLPDSPERPWPAELRGRSGPRPQFLPSEAFAMMDSADVHRAVVVPPNWAGDDNTPCLQWAQEHPDRLAVMGRFNLWEPDRERIETWLDQPGMLGIRMSGPTDRGEWLDVDEFGWFWSAVERLNIPVMALVARERIQLLGRLAEHHPGLRIIIDHLGVGGGRPGGELDPWEFIDDTLALHRLPNVWAKMSALPLSTTEAYPYPSLYDNLKRVFDTFGPRRLAWGSDCSRFVQSTYEECVDHVRYALDFLTDEDKEWILGRTISEVLGWPEPTTDANP